MFKTKSFVSFFLLVSLIAAGSANVIVNVGELVDDRNEVVDAGNDDVVVNVRKAFGLVDGNFAQKVIDVRRNVYGCIANGGSCQPDGSQGTCCSGFCYKQEGWAVGNCK